MKARFIIRWTLLPTRISDTRVLWEADVPWDWMDEPTEAIFIRVGRLANEMSK